MNRPDPVTVGELVSYFYEEFLALYGDREIARVAAAAVVNDILVGGPSGRPRRVGKPTSVEAA